MATFAVTTQKGPNWMDDRGIREQPARDDHAQFFDQLAERGVVVLGGPISSISDEEVALLAVEAAGEQELRSTLGEDPWAIRGVPTCSGSSWRARERDTSSTTLSRLLGTAI